MVESRNRRSRDLAERALMRLLDAAGAHWSELVVVGGLVPDLVVAADGAHQGTNDVDIVLDIGVIYERDDENFSWLQNALDSAGFVPAFPDNGWNWAAEVDGAAVIMQFLVDVDDSLRQPIALPGAPQLTAMNVHGPRPAIRHSQTVTISGRAARVATLGSYLAAKAAAILGRDADKDLYDFAFVVVQAERSRPGQAAAAVLTATEYDRLLLVRAACERYAGPTSDGSTTYARLAVRSGVQDEIEALALDAWAAVTAFRKGISSEG